MQLHCHPSATTDLSLDIQVQVEQLAHGDLQLCYQLTGPLAQVRIPAPCPASAQDGLWQHTCFEVFIARQGAAAYREFNFSPSSLWAAYGFSEYRQRAAWQASQAPQISVSHHENGLQLTAILAAADLPEDTDALPLQLGVSAVIEHANTQLCYFALHHPSAQPDFHHRAGFVLTL